MKVDNLLIKCQCGCSMLEMAQDEDDCFYFVVWTHARDERKITSWRERLRWCLNILKTGELWADHIIISNKEAERIIEYISNKLSKNE